MGQEEAKEKDRAVGGADRGRDGAEDDDDEHDERRWQVPFVMGRLCAQLGRDPQTILKTLAEALRLAQVTRCCVVMCSWLHRRTFVVVVTAFLPVILLSSSSYLSETGAFV